MAIRFRCRDCGAVLKAPETAAGRRVRCTGCGKVAAVPRPKPAPKPVAAPSPSKRIAKTSPVKAPAIKRPAPIPLLDDAEPEPPFEFRRHKAGETEMDMTPMVDVTFLLLIFFMVTAAFSLQKAIPVPSSEQEEAARQTETVEDLLDDTDYVVVHVDADNTYRLTSSIWNEEQDAPSDQQMRVKLREARGGTAGGGRRPNKLLVIASADARHDKVVTAIDAGNDVGMEDIKLTTVETEE